MKTRTLSIIAVALLSLTACSSGSPSDPTTETTTPATNPGSNDSPVAAGDFCGALDAWQTSQTDDTESQTALSDALDGITDPTDPAGIAAVQAWGAEVKASSDLAVANLQAAQASVDDPEVAAAIDTMILLYTNFTLPMADAAIAATDVYSYGLVGLEALNTEGLDTLISDASNAGMVISTYAREHCS
jgi:hypothetical protein